MNRYLNHDETEALKILLRGGNYPLPLKPSAEGITKVFDAVQANILLEMLDKTSDDPIQNFVLTQMDDLSDMKNTRIDLMEALVRLDKDIQLVEMQEAKNHDQAIEGLNEKIEELEDEVETLRNTLFDISKLADNA